MEGPSAGPCQGPLSREDDFIESLPAAPFIAGVAICVRHDGLAHDCRIGAMQPMGASLLPRHPTSIALHKSVQWPA